MEVRQRWGGLSQSGGSIEIGDSPLSGYIDGGLGVTSCL